MIRTSLAVGGLLVGRPPLGAVVVLALALLVGDSLDDLPALMVLAALAAARLAWWVWRRPWRALGASLLAILLGRVRVRKDHAEVAARVVATWDQVMARTGGVEAVARSSWSMASLPLAVMGLGIRREAVIREEPPRFSLRSTDRGVHLLFPVPVGYSPARYLAQVEVYQAAWLPREVIALPAPPGQVALLLAVGPDPLDKPIELPAAYRGAAPVERPTVKEVTIGVTEAGSPANLSLFENHSLLGGLPGAGKSGGLSAIMAGAAQVKNLALFGLDPKRVELASWAARFARIESEPEGMTGLLRRLVEVMEHRYSVLAAERSKKLEPGPGNPLIVLVVDELAEVISGGVTKAEKDADAQRATLLRRLVAKGRAAGITVIAATQKPDSQTVPTALRDLFSQRIAFKTGNQPSTEVILGGMSSGAPAHELTQRGVCYMVRDGALAPEKVRVYWLPDEQVAELAQNTRHLNVAALEGANHG